MINNCVQSFIAMINNCVQSSIAITLHENGNMKSDILAFKSQFRRDKKSAQNKNTIAQARSTVPYGQASERKPHVDQHLK